MKQLPNTLSVLRILAAFLMLFTKPLSPAFFTLYLFCGVSDVLDGFFARKFDVRSKTGALLDSAADFCFFAVLLILFVPILHIHVRMLFWVIAIAAIRFITLAVGAVKFRTAAALHTIGNKITGFLLFLFPLFLLLFGTTPTVVILCTAASLSSIEELVIQIWSKELDRDVKSIFPIRK